MKKIEFESGAVTKHPTGYICSLAEFERNTDAPDGSELQVVDESKNEVVNYCVSFNGKWIDR